MPSAVAKCDLPVPLGPTNSTFSRRSRYSPFTSSSIRGLLMLGRAAKSNSSSSLWAGKRAAFSLRSADFAFPLDQFQLTQLQQKRQMIGIVLSSAGRDLLALGMHRGELERFEVVLQQDRALGLGLVHGDTSSSRA